MKVRDFGASEKVLEVADELYESGLADVKEGRTKRGLVKSFGSGVIIGSVDVFVFVGAWVCAVGIVAGIVKLFKKDSEK